MKYASLRARLDPILPTVEKPGRYVGLERNVIRKDLSGCAATLALAFPDARNLPIQATPSLGVLGFAFLVSLFGGALALLLLSLRRWPLPAALMGQSWLVRLHDSRSGIPYGIALAAGALVLLPHTDIFRLAVTG